MEFVDMSRKMVDGTSGHAGPRRTAWPLADRMEIDRYAYAPGDRSPSNRGSPGASATRSVRPGRGPLTEPELFRGYGLDPDTEP